MTSLAPGHKYTDAALPCVPAGEELEEDLNFQSR